MSVKLIAMSKPMIDECSTADELIAYCARVSNPNNQNNHLTSNNLIKYLIKNKHWSPFEMVHITLEINTTRDIARQILRHRSFSFQEFSQRYADPTNDLGFTIRDARLQDKKNRQNSIVSDDKTLQDQWELQQTLVTNAALTAYNLAIEMGIAKEQARAVLPEGLTNSRLYVSGTLRSWYHYCELRSANGTQLEHQSIANQCWKIILEHFPTLKDI